MVLQFAMDRLTAPAPLSAKLAALEAAQPYAGLHVDSYDEAPPDSIDALRVNPEEPTFGGLHAAQNRARCVEP